MTPQRFIINEKLQELSLFRNMLLTKGGKHIYMLPLTSNDTFSIITTTEGKLSDPFGDNSKHINDVLKKVKDKLLTDADMNPKADYDDIGIEVSAITGTALGLASKDTKAVNAPAYTRLTDIEGVYNKCENLLIDPSIGPFEKNIAAIYAGDDNEYGEIVDGLLKWKVSDVEPNPNASQTDIEAYNAWKNEFISRNDNLTDNISDSDFNDFVKKIYLQMKERSFTISYTLGELEYTEGSSYQDLRENMILNKLTGNEIITINSTMTDPALPLLTYDYSDSIENSNDLYQLEKNIIDNNYIVTINLSQDSNLQPRIQNVISGFKSNDNMFVAIVIPIDIYTANKFICKSTVQQNDSNILKLTLNEHTNEISNALALNDQLPLLDNKFEKGYSDIVYRYRMRNGISGNAQTWNLNVTIEPLMVDDDYVLTTEGHIVKDANLDYNS